MALACHVATVDKTIRVQPGVKITDTLNGRSTCSLRFHDVAVGGYRPAMRDELLLEDGAADLFGGLIWKPQESGLGGLLDVDTDATGFAAYLDGVWITETFPAGSTPFYVLDKICDDYLTVAYGITADPTIDNVTALPELVYNNRKCSEVVAEVCLLVPGGLVWDVTPAKLLRALAPGAAAFGTAWAITDAVTHIIDPVRFPPDASKFADRIILQFGSGTAFIEGTDAYEGNGVRRTFALAVPPTTTPVAVTADPGAAIYNVGIYGIDDIAHGGALVWTYQASTQSLIQDPSVPALTAGQYLRPYYMAAYPGTVISDAGHAHPVADVVLKPDCFSMVVAQRLADGIRAQRQVDLITLTYSTYLGGLAPGQIQSIQLSARNTPTPTDFLITDITRQHVKGTMWRYDVTAQLGAAYLGSWRDAWGELGGGSAGTVISGGGGGGGAVSSLPVKIGGSRSQGISTASWTFIPEYVTFVAPVSGNYIFGAEVQTTDAGTTVQARLYDVTAAAAVSGSTTTASASLTWDDKSQPVTLIAGHRYRVQLIGSNANADVMVGQATMVM